jgi:hypothetical protein
MNQLNSMLGKELADDNRSHTGIVIIATNESSELKYGDRLSLAAKSFAFSQRYQEEFRTRYAVNAIAMFAIVTVSRCRSRLKEPDFQPSFRLPYCDMVYFRLSGLAQSFVRGRIRRRPFDSSPPEWSGR